MRPPDSRSKVAISRASCRGRRRGTGVTWVPSRIRSVARAAAASRMLVAANSPTRSLL
jgi:hypothetical protein